MSEALKKLANNHLHTRWSLVAFEQDARKNANIAVSDINSDVQFTCKGETLRLPKDSLANPTFGQFNQACKVARKALEVPAGQDLFSDLRRG